MSAVTRDWNPTPEQELAISTTGTDLLVTASAGSGKTKVLVERVIDRVLGAGGRPPLDVDQFLVVTFTEAAALQMRERVAAAIRERLAVADSGADAGSPLPPHLLTHLRRQNALIGRAAISTLHSFCLGICRRHFHQLDLDPAFDVLSEEEAALLGTEVLEEVFEHRYEAADPAFLELVEAYGGERGDGGLRETVLRLHQFSRSHPDPDGWLDRSAGAFEVPPHVLLTATTHGQGFLKHLRIALKECENWLVLAERLAGDPDGPRAYAATLADDRRRLKRLRKSYDPASGEPVPWSDLGTALVEARQFDRLPSVRSAGGETDKSRQRALLLKETARNLREGAKKGLERLDEVLAGRAEADLRQDLERLAGPMRALTRLVADFETAYRQAKESRGVVDFNDLEHLCLRVLGTREHPPGLSPTAAALELRERYTEVLVDEYQDTNGVQEAILSLVSTGRNRFMVGDAKQSIYRFRLADPQLFIHKERDYQSVRATGPTGPGASREPADLPSGPPDGRKIVLSHNFRSRKPILDAVNFVFRQVMWDEAEMEIDYHAGDPERGEPGVELIYGAGDSYGPPGTEGPAVELHLVTHAPSADGSSDGSGAATGEAGDTEEDAPTRDASAPAPDDVAALEREAHIIARRIREIVGQELVYDARLKDGPNRGYRLAAYRDIVILMRSMSGLANRVLDVLNANGIPAHAQLNTGYFAATEVELVLSLLRLIDNPRQDIPLAAVLRSPIVGLDEVELARIRLADRTGDYYRSVEAYLKGPSDEGAPHPDPDLADRLRSFLRRLDAWRTAARRGPLADLVWRLYHETGYYAYAGGLPGGRQRQANLRTLHDRARQFDQFSRQGLVRFLRFIDRLREEEGDLGPPPALGEGEDVVRLMSIHRSKGLEFPIVFVANLGKRFNLVDAAAELICHRELGFGPLVVDVARRVKYPSLPHWATARQVERDAIAEELRILYVAMTRARDHLILVGGARKLDQKLAYWCLAAGGGSAGGASGTGGGGDGDTDRGRLPTAVITSARTSLDWLVPAVSRHPHGSVLHQAAGLREVDPGEADLREAGLEPAPGNSLPPWASDPSRWSVRLWDTAEHGLFEALPLGPETGHAEAADQSLDWSRIARREPLPAIATGAITDALDWVYPYRYLSERPAKVVPTELKRLLDDVDREEAVSGIPSIPASPEAPGPRAAAAGGLAALRPAFLEDEPAPVAPTVRGQATHLLLQHVDLGGRLDLEHLARLVGSLIEREIMTPAQGEAADVRAVARFFETDLGRRLVANRDRVRRELPFTLSLPLHEIYPDPRPRSEADADDHETVFIQGIIDVVILDEADGLTVLDFKTDRVTAEEAPARAESYRWQMGLYRRAVSEIWRHPVRSVVIYFLTPGVAVEVNDVACRSTRSPRPSPEGAGPHPRS